MQKWQFWTGVGFLAAFILYCRSVTYETEKIDNPRRKGIMRAIFLGIPFTILIVLTILYWKEILFYMRNF